MIVVVDCIAANLLSITRALEAAGASVTISGDPRSIAATEGVVLPGVGAAGSAMDTLRASGADRALRDTAARGRPLLGVCLGMQLFFERLTEDSATGLGLLHGASPLLSPGQKIPHMCWNSLSWTPGAPALTYSPDWSRAPTSISSTPAIAFLRTTPVQSPGRNMASQSALPARKGASAACGYTPRRAVPRAGACWQIGWSRSTQVRGRWYRRYRRYRRQGHDDDGDDTLSGHRSARWTLCAATPG